jgi:hypothetical protein
MCFWGGVLVANVIVEISSDSSNFAECKLTHERFPVTIRDESFLIRQSTVIGVILGINLAITAPYCRQ